MTNDKNKPRVHKTLPVTSPTTAEKAEQSIFFIYLFFLCFITLPFGSAQQHFSFFLSGFTALLTVLFCINHLFFFKHQENKPAAGSLKKAWAVILLFTLVIVWQIVQLIPLDRETLAILSPERALYYWPISPPQKLSISFSELPTIRNILLSSAYLMIFLLTIGLLNSTKRLSYFLYTLVVLGSLQAIYGSTSVLSGYNSVLGFEKPETYAGHATGTFFNYNHYANLLTICASATIGLLLSGHNQPITNQWKQRIRELIKILLDKKLVFRIALTLMVIAIVLSKSRMGNSAFFFSLMTGGMIWLSLSGKLNKGFLGLFISMLVIDVFIISHWFGLLQLLERFETTELDLENRTLATPYLIAMFNDFKLTGVGSGQFEFVFPLYNQMNTDKFYNEAHNDYLQFLIELGIIGFTPLFLAVARFCPEPPPTACPLTPPMTAPAAWPATLLLPSMTTGLTAITVPSCTCIDVNASLR